jgi:hypothetical protein
VRDEREESLELSCVWGNIYRWWKRGSEGKIFAGEKRQKAM